MSLLALYVLRAAFGEVEVEVGTHRLTLGYQMTSHLRRV
jgi:hypothetical protein